jgi:hypothetical protein
MSTDGQAKAMRVGRKFIEAENADNWAAADLTSSKTKATDWTWGLGLEKTASCRSAKSDR